MDKRKMKLLKIQSEISAVLAKHNPSLPEGLIILLDLHNKGLHCGFSKSNATLEVKIKEVEKIWDQIKRDFIEELKENEERKDD